MVRNCNFKILRLCRVKKFECPKMVRLRHDQKRVSQCDINSTFIRTYFCFTRNISILRGNVAWKTFYYSQRLFGEGTILGEKERTGRLSLVRYVESRAEISAPQFGDNRIPPLHTILVCNGETERVTSRILSWLTNVAC